MKGTQNEANNDLRQDSSQELKPLYQCPKLTIHGSAQELTKSVEDGQFCDSSGYGNDPCS